MTADEITAYRRYIEEALQYAGGTHTFEDVVTGVLEGRFQFWPGQTSAIVTEIVEYPQLRAVNVFLAGGNLAELEAMTPLLENWAREQGCTRAQFTGRRGWERTYLARSGWRPSLVVLEKSLDG